MRDRRQTAMVVALSLLATSVFPIGACANSLTITAPTADAKCLFSDATPGTQDITCEATVVPDTLEGPGWSHPSGVPDGTTASWPIGNSGPAVTLRLTGLPTYNDPPGLNNGLGDFEIKAGIPDSPCGVIWKFVTVHLFFPRDATNHPGLGSGTTPNWYYYWSQTSADYGTHNYGAGTSYTDFVDGAWRSYIGDDAPLQAAAGTWDNAEGIDYFANVVRHEERHRQDFSWLWGAGNNRTDAGDPDGDYLPTNNGSVTENSLGTPYHEGGYDPQVAASVPDDLHYGAGFRDCEDYALHREAAWTNGSADGVDWANPGHQY